jgi:hypothetical protein
MKTIDSFKEIIIKQQEMIEKLIELNANSSMNFIPMFMGLVKKQIEGGCHDGQHNISSNELFIHNFLKNLRERSKP